MKPLATLFAVSALFGLLWTSSIPGPSAQPSPVPFPPATGSWTTGSTGVLGNVTYGSGTHTINLATTGYYDANQWMVFLDYNTLTVQPGATIKFLNHPSRAPVVMRALGPIQINGTIDLDGAKGKNWNQAPDFAEPGPGGFRGGRGSNLGSSSSAGLGVGGGFGLFNGPDWSGAGAGSHQSEGDPHSAPGTGPTYGSLGAVPLVGGSGAGGGLRQSYGAGGGAGGGAILIGSDSTLSIAGIIRARGGDRGDGAQQYNYGGEGSGGTIRIVAPQVTLTNTCQLLTTGGRGFQGSVHGGYGYVRIEYDGDENITNNNALIHPDTPSWSNQLGEFIPQGLPIVALHSYFDPDADADGEWLPISQDPRAATFPATLADVQLSNPGPTMFRIQGLYVPLGSPLHVRITNTRSQAVIDSDHTMGEVAPSTFRTSWTDVEIDLTGGVSAIQVRAEL